MYVHNLAHISIHALLAESDSAPAGKRAGRYYFYPRSPCGERRILGWRLWDRQQFLSTLSLRRATLFLRSGPMMHQYFYPRSPCGERRKLPKPLTDCVKISIHALLAESDSVTIPTPWESRTFLSTLSLRRATVWCTCLSAPYVLISIHALLAESDLMKERTINWHQFLSTLSLRRATSALYWFSIADRYFYPRSPCGERQAIYIIWVSMNKFLSTLSLRRATIRAH